VAETVQEGELITIEVFVGEEADPIRNFYGVALELSYSAAADSPLTGLSFDTEPNSWIDRSGMNSLSFFKDELVDGRSYLTLSRTNQSAVPGGGKVGEFSIIMEDIIFALDADTLHIQVDSIFLIDRDLNVVPSVPDTTKVIVTKNPNHLGALFGTVPTKIYPNPSHQSTRLTIATELAHCTLYNARGQVIPLRQEQLSTTNYDLQWPENLPVGVYFLRLQTRDGRTQSQKLLIY
jgi:hypothetical protein